MIQEIEKEFRSRGVIRGNMLLFPLEVTLEFIRESRKRNIETLGVDAFRLISERELQPDMEHSLDVSLEHFANFTREEKLAVAERFVEARLSTDLYFEMAPGDPA